MKLATKKEMATAIVNKWSGEKAGNKTAEAHAELMCKKYGWHKIAEIYEKEIGRVPGRNY